MKFFVLQRLLFFLVLLFFASVSASAYYDTSGTYEVAVPSLKVLDYPDSRASSICELSAGTVISTFPTKGQDIIRMLFSAGFSGLHRDGWQLYFLTGEWDLFGMSLISSKS